MLNHKLGWIDCVADAKSKWSELSQDEGPPWVEALVGAVVQQHRLHCNSGRKAAHAEPAQEQQSYFERAAD